MRIILIILSFIVAASAQVRLNSIKTGPSQPGDTYIELDYPLIITNYVTNFFMSPPITTNILLNASGVWTNPAYRVSLQWTGGINTTCIVETSVSLVTNITNGVTIGDKWRPCSGPITNFTDTTRWTSGVPFDRAFYRIRLLSTFSAPPSLVTLGWDPNSEINLAGYRLYQGVASRTYTNTTTLGRTTRHSVPLIPNRTNFFAVTAYDNNGLESEPSNEVILESKNE